MDDVDYLANNLGLMTHEQIAQKLNRTVEAIKLAANRRGFSYYDNFYSYALLSKELGVCRATLRKYVKRGLLKGHKANWTSAYGHHPMIFVESGILNFLRKCNGQFADRHIPNPYFRYKYQQFHQESHASI